MTEAEWLTANSTQQILEFLRDKDSVRKLHLFACACCRQFKQLLVDKRSWKAIEVAERFVDGLATIEEQESAWRAACAAASKAARGDDDCVHIATATVADDLVNGPFPKDHSAQRCSTLIDDLARDSKVWAAVLDKIKTQQASLLRDIFGNPFRPVTFSPLWRTDTTVALARQMYESREFAAMPILADALQDAGCDNPDILSHCRNEKAGGGSGEPAGGSSAQGGHVRGCWVVDLVLGKE